MNNKNNRVVAVDLFGGAMKVSIPCSLVDESDVYPIPDNQEVYHDTETQQTLIIEIVQHVEERAMQGKSPGLFYAHDLADMNHAELRIVMEPRHVLDEMTVFRHSLDTQEVAECILCTGMLDESKVLHLLVIRIPGKGSDVLISMLSHRHSDSVDDEDFQLILETFEIVDWSLFG